MSIFLIRGVVSSGTSASSRDAPDAQNNINQIRMREVSQNDQVNIEQLQASTLNGAMPDR